MDLPMKLFIAGIIIMITTPIVWQGTVYYSESAATQEAENEIQQIIDTAKQVFGAKNNTQISLKLNFKDSFAHSLEYVKIGDKLGKPEASWIKYKITNVNEVPKQVSDPVVNMTSVRNDTLRIGKETTTLYFQKIVAGNWSFVVVKTNPNENINWEFYFGFDEETWWTGMKSSTTVYVGISNPSSTTMYMGKTKPTDADKSIIAEGYDRPIANYIGEQISKINPLAKSLKDAQVFIFVGGPEANYKNGFSTKDINDKITMKVGNLYRWGWETNGTWESGKIRVRDKVENHLSSGVVGGGIITKDVSATYKDKKFVLIYGKGYEGTIMAARVFLKNPAKWIDWESQNPPMPVYCENRYIEREFEKIGGIDYSIKDENYKKERVNKALELLKYDMDWSWWFLKKIGDTDNDGLKDNEEIITNSYVWDTDGDSLPDGWEVKLKGLGYSKNPLNRKDAYGFTLSVNFDWNEKDWTYFYQFEQGLRYASNYLFDITDGYFFIKKVDIYDSNSKTDADIRVSIKDEEIANHPNDKNWPHAYIGKYLVMPKYLDRDGTPQWWEYVLIYGFFNKGPRHPNEPDYYRAIIHELGHSKLYLWDEYCYWDKTMNNNKGGWRQLSNQQKPPSFMNNDLVYSEMSTPTTYQNTNYQMTAQWQFNKESCWETVFKKYNSQVNFDFDGNGITDTQTNNGLANYVAKDGPLDNDYENPSLKAGNYPIDIGSIMKITIHNS